MKIFSIQILRGFAAWVVVFHHFMLHFFNLKLTNPIGNFFLSYGQIGVDIFFVISGLIMTYILTTTNKSSMNFLMNRVIRIVPNYWLWTTLFLLMGLFFKEVHSSQATLSTVLMSLLFIPHDNPSELLSFYPTLTVGWTLNIEMFFYFIVSLVLLLSVNMKFRLVIIGLLMFSLPLIYKLCQIEVYKVVAGNIKLIEFAVGVFLYILWQEYKNIYYSKTLIVSVTLTILVIFIIDIPMHFKFIFISLFVVFMALRFEHIVIKNKDKFFVKECCYLGDISYSTYLCHSLVIWTIFILFQHFSYFNPVIGLIAVVIVTFFSSLISYKFFEIELSSLLRRRFVN